MGRLATSVVAATVLAFAAALPTSAAPSRPQTVFHYGDSLTVGTNLYLAHFLPRWSISESADISRHTADGPEAVKALGTSLPRVLAISLGANDDPGAVGAFAAAVRQVTRAAGSTRCVVWSTIVRPPYNGVSYEGYNRVLRRAAVSYGNFHVFDWQALAKAHPQWFGSDGVHPSAAGYRMRAAALARLIKTC